MDVFDFSVLLTVSILFISEILEVMDSSTVLGFDFHFLSTVSIFPSLSTLSIVVTNYFSISSKSPLDFLTFSLGASDSLGNGPLAFLTSSIGTSELLVNGSMTLDGMV